MEKVNLSELRSIPMTPAFWEVIYNGSGKVEFERQTRELLLVPKVPEVPEQTFAALVVLKQLQLNPVQDFVVRLEVSTEKQLRVGTAPNDWEVFWFFSNYRRSEKGTKEANYFILKPKSGVELGLVFDEVGQTFLKTAATPQLKIPAKNEPLKEELIFIKRGASFRAYRNQYLIMDYKDGDATSRLFTHGGTFGLYSEDAQVRVHSFSFKAL